MSVCPSLRLVEHPCDRPSSQSTSGYQSEKSAASLRLLWSPYHLLRRQHQREKRDQLPCSIEYLCRRGEVKGRWCPLPSPWHSIDGDGQHQGLSSYVLLPL